MAKPKYTKWQTGEGLSQIENWAAKGLTYEEIAHNMGVSRSTLHEWISKHQDISDAIKSGRNESIVSIENMAFKLATGQAVEEISIETTGKDGISRTETRTRKMPPSSTMVIFLLKNRAGYSDNPNDTRKESTDEEVKAYVRSLGLS